jgi:hypothetical protein
MTRRRAVIVTAGNIEPRDDLPLAVAAEPFDTLDFTTERADELERMLSGHFRFDVHRMDDAESAHLAQLHETRPEAVSIFHFIGHGAVRGDGLHFVPANRNFTPLTSLNAVIARLNEIQPEEHDHHYLVVLDMCEAGGGLDELPHGRAKNIWIACAADDQPTYAGQFSKSFAEVLGTIDVGDSEEFLPMDRLWRQVNTHFRESLFKSLCDGRNLSDQELGQLKNSLPTPRTLGRFSTYTETVPPFFPNPRFTRAAAEEESARDEIDARLHPFLDAPHFADRVGSHFTGRSTILEALGTWRTEPNPESGLYLVTGAAGSGKSTIVGATVFTCHPDILGSHHYGEAQKRLSQRLPTTCTVPVNAPIAAVHARQRQLDEVLSGFIDQLASQGALDPERVKTETELADWTSAQPEPPLFILDALDEASKPDDLVYALLRPLLAVRRNGRPASRILVAGRNDTDRNKALLNLLEHSAAEPQQVDLNLIDPEEVRLDLTAFLEDVLHTDSLCCRSKVRPFAQEMASALVDRSDSSQYGLFLTAGLYAAHLRRRFEHLSGGPETHLPEQINPAAEEIPGSLPEVLELDFKSVADPAERRRRRAVLAALAHARGQGMPASIAGVLARDVFDGGELNAAALLHDSKGVKVYLRSATDPSDEAPLYRLFHQSLNDYLRVKPIAVEDQWR